MESNNLIKLIHFRGFRIRLASPQMIRRWAEKELPNGKLVGQVTNPQTVNYQKMTRRFKRLRNIEI